jgi:hypothetical protein
MIIQTTMISIIITGKQQFKKAERKKLNDSLSDTKMTSIILS